MLIYLHIIYTDEHKGAITIIKEHKLDSVNFFQKNNIYTLYTHYRISHEK